MHDDRHSLVSFKSVEPTKPASGIDPELLDDDGTVLRGAVQARCRILNTVRVLDIEPGSDVHDAVKRHMRWMIRQKIFRHDPIDWVRRLSGDPEVIDREILEREANVVRPRFGTRP